VAFAVYVINWLVFIDAVESVYSAVRTDCLYKADYVWSSESLYKATNGIFSLSHAQLEIIY
jgi:hypothetical protein